MDFIDSTAQDSWELVAEIGFAVVIVGVALEIIDLVVKWRKRHREESILSKDPRWLWWVEFASVILVVLGLAVEFIGGIEASLIARHNSNELRKQVRAAVEEAGAATKTAASLNLRASSNELARVELEKKIEEMRAERLEIEKQAAPRRLRGKLKQQITSALGTNTDSVLIITPPNDEECSDFANDIEVALIDAKWKTSRREAEIPLQKFGPYMTSKRLRGVGVGTLEIKSERADRLIKALAPLEDIRLANPVRMMGFGFEPGVLYLIVAQKPPVGFDTTLFSRKFKDLTEAKQRLSKYSWTNTVVVSDPRDNDDAEAVARQILETIDARPLDPQSMPWLSTNHFMFSAGVKIEVTDCFWYTNRSDANCELQQRKLDEQATALRNELNNVNITAKVKGVGPRQRQGNIPYGWMIVRVGAKPDRETTAEIMGDNDREDATSLRLKNGP